MDICNQKPEHTYVQYICEYDEEACIICVMYAGVPHTWTTSVLSEMWFVIGQKLIDQSYFYKQCTSGDKVSKVPCTVIWV